MRNRLVIFITSIIFSAQINSQFLDTTIPVNFDGPGQLSKVGSQNILTGSVFEIPKKYTIQGAAVRFSGDASALVSFQFLNASGDWTKELSANIFLEPNSDRFIASILNDRLSSVIAFRYIVRSKDFVNFLSGGVFDITSAEPSGDQSTPKLLPKSREVDKPKVISRKEWGAKEPKYGYSNHPYFDKMTLHHAAGWAAKSLNEGKAAVRSIQDFHQDGRGWSDIGYHFLVDMAGNIYQGRPETVLGAHVGGANTGNIGVCLLGCYHPPETSIPCYDEVAYGSEKSLIHLYAWISETYGVKPTVLKGHRDYFGTTSCPGDNAWATIPDLKSEISLFINFGVQPTRFVLFQNYPNPFNTQTTLHYDLPEPSQVNVKIFDILGNEVVELVNQEQAYGYKKIVWDGTNSHGRLVSPGVYFYKAELGNLVEIKKMILIK